MLGPELPPVLRIKQCFYARVCHPLLGFRNIKFLSRSKLLIRDTNISMLDLERTLEINGYDLLIIILFIILVINSQERKSEISENQTRKNNSPLDLTPKHKYWYISQNFFSKKFENWIIMLSFISMRILFWSSLNQIVYIIIYHFST